MIKTVKKDVPVNICDFCNDEVSALMKCVICKRDMCNAGMGKHTSHTLEVHSYKFGSSIPSAHICKECAEKRTSLTIGQLLDAMFGDSPVPTIGDIGSAVSEVKSKDDCLLDILMELGFVDVDVVALARADAKAANMDVVDFLVANKVITVNAVAQAKAAQFGVDVVHLPMLRIEDDVIHFVPSDIARKYRIIPLFRHDNTLGIAIADPSNLNALDSLTHLLNAEIEPRIATEEEIEAALKKYYSDGQ